MHVITNNTNNIELQPTTLNWSDKPKNLCGWGAPNLNVSTPEIIELLLNALALLAG